MLQPGWLEYQVLESVSPSRLKSPEAVGTDPPREMSEPLTGAELFGWSSGRAGSLSGEWLWLGGNSAGLADESPRLPDASMALNGALAGLVSITAPCDGVTPVGAIMIGAIGGALVVFSVLFIDRVVKVDDPVGAVSVHGVCGAWGTIAAGLFNMESGLFYGGGIKQLGVQFAGVGAGFVWAFVLGLVMFMIIKKTVGLRVSAEEELKGLDISEHGMEAYNGFQIFRVSDMRVVSRKS